MRQLDEEVLKFTTWLFLTRLESWNFKYYEIMCSYWLKMNTVKHDLLNHSNSNKRNLTIYYVPSFHFNGLEQFVVFLCEWLAFFSIPDSKYRLKVTCKQITRWSGEHVLFDISSFCRRTLNYLNIQLNWSFANRFIFKIWLPSPTLKNIRVGRERRKWGR